MPRLKSLYESIEQPLVGVLYRMERTGVLVDRELLQEAEQRTRGAHVGIAGPGSRGSRRHLQRRFPEAAAGNPVRQIGHSGDAQDADRPAFDRGGRLGGIGPDVSALPKLILEYRGIAKLKSTYTDKLPEQIDRETGRIHTSYHQAVAATGRLSSADPNLQNIPIRTPEGRRIRQAFIAAPGHTLIAADYSQIELRIMAHLSGDASLLAAFAEDRDVHQATAAEVFGVSLADVTADQRRSAKAINFGLIYGMSAFGLARQLGIGRGEAQNTSIFISSAIPASKRYMDETRQKARDAGFVETVVRAAVVSAGNPVAKPGAAPIRRTQRHQCAHAGHRGGHHQARHDRRRCMAAHLEDVGAPHHAGA